VDPRQGIVKPATHPLASADGPLAIDVAQIVELVGKQRRLLVVVPMQIEVFAAALRKIPLVLSETIELLLCGLCLLRLKRIQPAEGCGSLSEQLSRNLDQRRDS
jgi:hypothetical protein